MNRLRTPWPWSNGEEATPLDDIFAEKEKLTAMHGITRFRIQFGLEALTLLMSTQQIKNILLAAGRTKVDINEVNALVGCPVSIDPDPAKTLVVTIYPADSQSPETPNVRAVIKIA